MTEAELIDHARAQPRAASSCPRRIHFVDELPRNQRGKLLKRELREGT